MTKQNACAVIIVILKSDDLKQFKEKLLLLLIRICIYLLVHLMLLGFRMKSKFFIIWKFYYNSLSGLVYSL